MLSETVGDTADLSAMYDACIFENLCTYVHKLCVLGSQPESCLSLRYPSHNFIHKYPKIKTNFFNRFHFAVEFKIFLHCPTEIITHITFDPHFQTDTAKIS